VTFRGKNAEKERRRFITLALFRLGKDQSSTKWVREPRVAHTPEPGKAAMSQRRLRHGDAWRLSVLHKGCVITPHLTYRKARFIAASQGSLSVLHLSVLHEGVCFTPQINLPLLRFNKKCSQSVSDGVSCISFSVFAVKICGCAAVLLMCESSIITLLLG